MKSVIFTLALLAGSAAQAAPITLDLLEAESLALQGSSTNNALRVFRF